MSEAIIVALITASASVICQLLISSKQRKDNEVKQALRDKDFEDRLLRIQERLDTHNNYAEKLNDMSISLAKMSKDIEYLKEGK